MNDTGPTSERGDSAKVLVGTSREFLLAEDNDDDVVLIREAFADAGIEHLLRVVPDGYEALEYLRRSGPYCQARTPSVVILDMNMPRMGGLDVLRAMKDDPAVHRIPVIILSTSHREADVTSAYSEGAATYIVKPPGFYKLREMVRDLATYWLRVARLPVRD